MLLGLGLGSVPLKWDIINVQDLGFRGYLNRISLQKP